jgi:RNA polymerase sigma factor (sigma-70 family)
VNEKQKSGQQRHDDAGQSALAQLARLAKQGDIQARNRLYLLCETQIRRLSIPAQRYARMVAAEDASLGPEDVEQQAFIAFCELLDRWDGSLMPFDAFLEKRLARRLYHYVRDRAHTRSKVRKVPMAVAADIIEATPAGGDQVEDEVQAHAGWLERAASLSLDERWKQLVMLRFQEGMSSGQIAAISGRSRRTINRNLRAAIRAIQDKIQEEWQGCG